MKRLSPLWFPAAALLVNTALAGAVFAQQQPPAPVPKPPVLEKLEEGPAPTTTIPDREGTTMTQKREQGVVKEVEVHSGGSNYTVRANEHPGSIHAGEAQATSARAPTWKVLEFNLGSKKEKKETVAPAPPPPPPAN